jgi:hypothetical protein
MRMPMLLVGQSGLYASSGWTSAINTENNVVVYANTGEIVEEFTYR